MKGITNSLLPNQGFKNRRVKRKLCFVVLFNCYKGLKLKEINTQILSQTLKCKYAKRHFSDRSLLFEININQIYCIYISRYRNAATIDT